ncbi:MAG: o-succinylbenzoate synthase [Bryobacteraceae bacterium]
MKIDRVTLTWVRIPLVEPFRISNGSVAEKDGIVVALHSDGLTGYGESSPMSGSFYSSDTPESCWRQLTEALVPALIGQKFASLEGACAWIDAQAGSNFAKVGIETAFWDLEAQRRGLPLHRLLGGERDRVDSGLAVGLYDTESALLATIERYLADGYKRVKIKIHRGGDVELVRAVRARFGAIPLMTDANADYTLEHRPVFEKLDEFGLMMFEQPLGGAMIAESAELQKHVKTPICFDESLEQPSDVIRSGELGGCRIANIKIQRVGGFANALRVYELARRHGMGIWVGTMPELGIGQAQGAALASLAACNYPTDVEASLRWFRDDIVSPMIEVHGGEIAMPQTPGLGYEVSAAKLERYQVARQEIR